jgi:hypothetical protein
MPYCTLLTYVTADGSAFLTFLGSYNIFISPICGVSIHRSPTEDSTDIYS